MPYSLNRKTKNGDPYQRSALVETWIEKLEALQPAERLQHFAIQSRSNPNYLPAEVLVYFLRRAWADGQHAEFKELFYIILRRIERNSFWHFRDYDHDYATYIVKEIVSRFSLLISKDCNGQTRSLDFYEIHFNQALSALRTSVLRQIGPATVDTVPLEADLGDGFVISPEVQAAATTLSGASTEIVDSAFRLKLTAAIRSLPNDQKQVVALFLKGFQFGSKDPELTTIASILQCDERTARNRLGRACKTLKTLLQEEVM